MQNRPDWVFLVNCPWFVLDPLDSIAHNDRMDLGTIPSPSLDWRGWLELWTDQHAATGSEQYAEQHRRRVVWFMELSGVSDFAEVVPRHAAKWFSVLSREGQPAPSGRQRPCSAKTLHSHKAAMVRFWRWLVTMEAIPAKPHTPFDGLQIPRAEQRDMRAFTADEAGRLIAWAERDERVVKSVRASPHHPASSPHDPQMIRKESAFVPDFDPLYRSTLYLLLSCIGLRVGEAARVRWSDLELDADPATLAVRSHKGKRKRAASYALPEALREALLYQRRATQPETRDAVWGFLSDRSANAARRVLVNDCKACGVDVEDGRGRRAGWHCFRRLVGSELARAGVSPKVAQSVLGHADAATTLKHYTNVEDAEKSAAINIVARRVYAPDKGKSNQNPSRGLQDEADDVDLQRHTPNPEKQSRFDDDHQACDNSGRRDRVVRGASPPPRRQPDSGYRFESCIAHSDPNARLLWHASELLKAAAEIAARLPEGEADGQQHHQPENSDRRG